MAVATIYSEFETGLGAPGLFSSPVANVSTSISNADSYSGQLSGWGMPTGYNIQSVEQQTLSLLGPNPSSPNALLTYKQSSYADPLSGLTGTLSNIGGGVGYDLGSNVGGSIGSALGGEGSILDTIGQRLGGALGGSAGAALGADLGIAITDALTGNNSNEVNSANSGATYINYYDVGIAPGDSGAGRLPDGTILRDWRHADRLFVRDNHRLTPKLGYMFHVAFDGGLSGNKSIEAGMLAKAVSLPKFSFDSKTCNAYNRPNVVLTKIKYDTVNLTFYDDSADIINQLLIAYNSHYFKDPRGGWGYDTNVSGHFFSAIRLYSLHKRRFTEYILVNPIIKSSRFGEHSGDSSAVMQIDMSLEPMNILTSYGSVSSESPDGFARLHYDKGPSPLGGGTPLGEISTGTYMPSVMSGYDPYPTASRSNTANFDNLDFGHIALNELLDVGVDILTGVNPLSGVSFPTSSSLSAMFGVGASNTGNSSGGITSNGAIVSNTQPDIADYSNAWGLANSPPAATSVTTPTPAYEPKFGFQNI